MQNYKLINDPMTNEACAVQLTIGEIRVSIPMIDGNRHYEEYKEWLAEGNTPEEPDEV